MHKDDAYSRPPFPAAEVVKSKAKRPSSHHKDAKKNQSSRFRGVSWSKSDCTWKCYIYVNGKQVSLGSFHDEEAAAFAYDEAARRHRGPNPFVNFPVAGSGELPAVKA